MFLDPPLEDAVDEVRKLVPTRLRDGHRRAVAGQTEPIDFTSAILIVGDDAAICASKRPKFCARTPTPHVCRDLNTD